MGERTKPFVILDFIEYCERASISPNRSGSRGVDFPGWTAYRLGQ